ncbi:hypothetical protein [Curtobacterium caseinilyticum]|uniref:Gram-positive cocci surface proteins LPxTG domain-containing protein n=1 Tax=Curtobacterium caseinilyticum TaxID=3055137 RepID=A0ABT7TRI2_9MICO|nr:hypothetical protein [Curtobacterium caseinilyticum]MDM7891449.1 hypothetical protein [Curtobacterium caseinilyticum]
MQHSTRPRTCRAAAIAVTVAATTAVSVVGSGAVASAAPLATPAAVSTASPATTTDPTSTSTAGQGTTSGGAAGTSTTGTGTTAGTGTSTTGGTTDTGTSTTGGTTGATPSGTTSTTGGTSPTGGTGTTGTTGTTGSSTGTTSGTAAAPLAFTDPGTEADPVELTATVGTPFSHTFTTTGGNGTVAYALQANPHTEYSVNVETGVLSGTPTTPGTIDLQVVALSGGTQVTDFVRLTVAPSPLQFTEPSSPSAPLRLTATAGTPFSHRFTATGGSGPVAYAIQDSPSEDLSVNVDTGVLTSTATEARTYSFQVVALRGTATATEYVQLTVEPGAPVGVVTIVAGENADVQAWSVAPDGTIERYDGGAEAPVRVSSIPVDQGGSLSVSGLAVDRFGNRTTPASTGSPVPRSTLTSSVASDEITWVPADFASKITFPHASDHVLTISEGGASTSFTVAVRPVVAPAATVAHTTGTPTTGTLAFTGADETTPIAWAVGLLAAGAALMLRRFRRRRA